MDEIDFKIAVKNAKNGYYSDVSEIILYADIVIDRLESEKEAILNNAIALVNASCDKHTGKNAPTWDEFTATIKDRCHMCDFEQIQKLEQLVKKAYLEGAKDALYYGNGCQSNVCGFSEEMWKYSDSKKELGTIP